MLISPTRNEGHAETSSEHCDARENRARAQKQNIRALSAQGFTPLGLASKGRHLEVVQALLAAGDDVNAKDDHGATALTKALKGGSNDVAELLRQYSGPE